MSEDATGPRWPTIPEPHPTPLSLLESVQQLKASMELLTGQGRFSEGYSVDARIDTITKTLNQFSSTVSSKFEVVVNEYGALAQRTTLVEAEIEAARDGEPSLNARIVEVDTASVNRDGALATSLDIVEARVNDVSAGGFFKTTASVSGSALVQMEAQVYTSTSLTATLTAGWRVRIESGVSYFDIFTNKLRLIDSGNVAKPVFTYSSGKFRFTGDVAIDGILVINGTVYTDTIAAAAVSQMTSNASASTAGFSMTLRAGAKVLLIATWTGDPGAVNLYPITATGTINILVNGNLEFSQLCGFFQDIPTNVSFSYRAPIPTTYQYVYTVPSAGTYTFLLYNVWNGSMNAIGVNYLSALELTR